jgi:hypoxanthine phosphoribosyltransferase
LAQSKTDYPEFSHPSEKTFADILDFYGIQWQYEPKTFPLIIEKDGKIIEAFTPDFYLPEQDLFIELTTLKPKLSNKKNRRIKMMKELYPEVNIKLLKRREMRDLMVKYGLYKQAGKIKGNQTQKE